MIIQERLTFGQTYVVRSDGPIKITQTGAHGTLVMVNVTDEAGTAGREVVFTAIDTAAEVEVDEGTNWSCVPGFNRGAASVQGGPAELPADQKTFLQWVTDGKLTFDATGRLQIATSVDATGTFNHDGYASNYTKTVDGVRYTTTVNATEVIVKKSVAGVETVLMHLHDGVLELGGERVLTEKLWERDMLANMLSAHTFRTYDEMERFFEPFYIGDSFYLAAAGWGQTGSVAQSSYYMLGALPNFENGTPFSKWYNSVYVQPRLGTKKFTMRFAGFPSSGDSYWVPHLSGCSFTFFINSINSLTIQRYNNKGVCANLEIVCNNSTFSGTNKIYVQLDVIEQGGTLSVAMNELTSIASGVQNPALFLSLKTGRASEVRVSYNSLGTDFSLGTSIALSHESVAYTLNTLKTVTTQPIATLGLDDRCVRNTGTEEEPVYEYRDGEGGTWGSGVLASAVAGAKSRGWGINIQPVSVI